MAGGNLEDRLLLSTPAATRRIRMLSSFVCAAGREVQRGGARGGRGGGGVGGGVEVVEEEKMLQMLSRPLSWKQRLHALIGAARALVYLHADDADGNKPPILHRDVKAANILLDMYGNARLCDAGLARLSPELVGQDVSHVSSVHICGTHGFVDPAYQQTGRLDASSDGYALGVCLLMCVTGWLALDNTQAEPVLVNRCHEVMYNSYKSDI